MSLVNKSVIHKTFGEGNVLNYNDSYIKIDFESGAKRFVFPDAFKRYITFTDQRAANLVKQKIQQKEEEYKKELLRLKKERALERERQKIAEQKKNMKSRRIHPKLQSVFWYEAEEEDGIFTEWEIFTGKVKSGVREGQPRQLPRMNQNSACLLTKRESNVSEKERRITGVFMVEEGFNGGKCEDGYISAHPKYRLRLSEEESEKMLFWNYYINERFPDRITWNSGRQRYFDNIWMAQILRDIVSIKEDPKEKEDAQLFFKHFCKINRIDEDELQEPKGAL